jgi:acetyl esterase/lipase
MSRNLLESLDPELRAPIAGIIAEAVTLDDISAARVASAKMMEAVKAGAPTAQGVTVEERGIPGPAGAPDVTVRIHRPARRGGALPALLWIHGGGYVLGKAEYEDVGCGRFAAEADCVVAAVEYRLAPEDPFPAALEDCYAALTWMAGSAGELGVDPSRIAIGGASAGGGLAAGLALLARDRAEVDPVFQLLVYPMVDDRNVRPAGETLPDTLFWTRANNQVAWRCYLGREPAGADISYYASACRSADLEGLPPAYISVGDQDLFLEEDVAYARRLIEAGVSTELHVYPGACHGFDMLVPEAGISRRFIADQVAALRRVLHRA